MGAGMAGVQSGRWRSMESVHHLSVHARGLTRPIGLRRAIANGLQGTKRL